MNTVDYILIVVIAAIVGGAIYAIARAKKRGKTCIGCPSGGTCTGKCGSCNCQCGCSHNKK